MKAFCRHRLEGDRDGHSFMLAILDTKTQKNHTLSWVNQELIDQTAAQDDLFKSFNLDPHFTEAILNQLKTEGPPKPLEVREHPTEIRPDPLNISCEDYSFFLDDNRFHLHFLDLATQKPCELTLLPDQGKTLNQASLEVSLDDREMAYISYPDLALEGYANGFPVTGRAWVDHQWGRHGWFKDGDAKKTVLCWDWFGFNLEDGSVWMIGIHRDAKTKEPLEHRVIVRDKAGKTQTSHTLKMEIRRYWESPRTLIRHPVEWAFYIPDFDSQFTFSPIFDDQEIPVFGLGRAVWEGAGIVKGRVAGKQVTGRARGELQGYGYLFEIKDYTSRLAEHVDCHINDFFPKVMDGPCLEKFLGSPTWKFEPDAYTEMISEPVWDLISRKGKRWRPIFGILLLDALGKSPQPFEALISNLAELAHSGSLIIDDIQDASLLRRGKESIHIRYGEDVAISAANTLYFLSSQLLFGHAHLTRTQQLDIHEVIMKQFIRAHFGQALDLYWSRNMEKENLQTWMNDSLEDKILQMYDLKTAAPIIGLASAAAIIAVVDRDVRKTCEDFARNLGVAFQIIDDVHNFSQSPQWRKTPGEDIAEGKMTYVILKTLMALDKDGRQHFQDILVHKENRADPQHLSEGVSVIDKSGVLDLCRQEAHTILEKSWEELSGVLEPSEAKILLKTMCYNLISKTLEKPSSPS